MGDLPNGSALGVPCNFPGKRSKFQIFSDSRRQFWGPKKHTIAIYTGFLPPPGWSGPMASSFHDANFTLPHLGHETWWLQHVFFVAANVYRSKRECFHHPTWGLVWKNDDLQTEVHHPWQHHCEQYGAHWFQTSFQQCAAKSPSGWEWRFRVGPNKKPKTKRHTLILAFSNWCCFQKPKGNQDWGLRNLCFIFYLIIFVALFWGRCLMNIFVEVETTTYHHLPPLKLT